MRCFFRAAALGAAVLTSACCAGGCKPRPAPATEPGREASTADAARELEKIEFKPLRADEPRFAAWAKQEGLAPIESGPGLIVFDPVTQDAALAEFATGCGRWLEVVVAGHPELGRSPSLFAQGRIRRRLKQDHFRLELAPAREAARRLGATHVAVGELSGGAADCRLRYRLHRVDNGEPVGQEVTLAGTREAVAAHLPRAARALAGSLGIAAARVPAETGLRPEGLAAIGRLLASKNAEDGRKAVAELAAAEGPSYVRDLFVSASDDFKSNAEWQRLTRRLLDAGGENQLVWAHLGQGDVSLLRARIDRLEALSKRFPKSHLLAQMLAWTRRTRGEADAELQTAERAVRLGPGSPDAWLTLAQTLAEAANSTRRGRFISDISAGEMAALEKLYERQAGAAGRAAQLDPDYGSAWLSLAQAATFAGNREAAEQAFWNAAKLVEPDERGQLYGWGLQMFHAKWGGDPASLARVARLAAAHKYSSITAALGAVAELENADFKTEARTLLRGTIKECRAVVQREPKNPRAHYALAMALVQADDHAGAGDAYREVTRYRTDVPDDYYQLGRALARSKRSEEAVEAFRKALSLDPRHAQARDELAWELKRQGKLKEAEVEAMAAVRANPALPEAYNTLGEVRLALRKHKEAVPAFRKAVALSPYFDPARRALLRALMESGQYAEGLKQAEALIERDPTDLRSRAARAYAFAKQKRYADCEAESRAMLEMDGKNAWAWESLGESLMYQGEKEEGRQALQRCMELDEGPIGAEARRVLEQFK